jgi:hypothetical protein
VSTTAQVIQKEQHFSGGRHSTWTYTLKYRYQDSAGETFESQGAVTLSVWEQSEKGHDLAIEYLRDAPLESRLLVDSPFWPRWVDVVGWTCCWGGPGLCCLIGAIVAFCKVAKN